MIPAYSYDQIIQILKYAFDFRYIENSSLKMTGLLFSPLYTRIAKEEIIPRLNYYHRRTGDNLDFFCAGYEGNLPPFEYMNDEVELGVTEPDTEQEISWTYSDTIFLKLRKEISDMTGRHYSGESDLILANAIYDKEFQTVALDFSSAIFLDLDLMLKDEPTLSVGRIFENICLYADTHLV